MNSRAFMALRVGQRVLSRDHSKGWPREWEVVPDRIIISPFDGSERKVKVLRTFVHGTACHVEVEASDDDSIINFYMPW